MFLCLQVRCHDVGSDTFKLRWTRVKYTQVISYFEQRVEKDMVMTVLKMASGEQLYVAETPIQIDQMFSTLRKFPEYAAVQIQYDENGKAGIVKTV